MSQAAIDPRIDRLYRLLPAIYRMRDAGQGYPLQALLRVIAEQVNLVEDSIAQQYENWFIETAAEWAVPYIAELVGYVPSPAELASPGRGLEEQLRDRWITPRREVANTVHYRRRKGALALLGDLGRDVTGWPARAVEFYRLLGWNQNINHPHLDRAHVVDIRQMQKLDLLDGPFDRIAHCVDVRRINSADTCGRTNIPSVGIFVWRLGSYSVTMTPAAGEEAAGPHCFNFSILGQDAPLFIAPGRGPAATGDGAGAIAYPGEIRRVAFDARPELYYGADRSFAVWAEDWAGFDSAAPIPLANVIPADLSGWTYVPPAKHIAIDPVLGRIAFPASQPPRKGVRVSYRYGFSADIGGGEYKRQIAKPVARQVRVPDPDHEGQFKLVETTPVVYRVGKAEAYQRIADALDAWKKDLRWDGVIELAESAVFVEPLQIDVPDHHTLELRAAQGARPVIRLLDWRADVPDSLTVTMGAGTRFVMDGLMVTGRSVQVSGPEEPSTPPAGSQPYCDSILVIRHCTLVPGWGMNCDCKPDRPTEPSLELFQVRCRVVIEHSILGSIEITEDEVRQDPIPVCITDSIIDAAEPGGMAISGPEARPAHAAVTILRCTVFGVVEVHSSPLAENSIFYDCVHVGRRQIGCMRYCYVPQGCRTPRRTACQPDLVVDKIKDETTDPAEQVARTAAEKIRLRPVFGSMRYGDPRYAQLADACAPEIVRGADDRSEMGVLHDLFQPLREANLRARLQGFIPAGADVGLIHAT
ncbi:hypothetical protein [Bradyrhizobium sp. Arg816]|uniref:hypothetical protein n=1 Tax=Bradyrhizobium sp. Arg816 TaxID=2998491 RepID=UPI00249F330E|nr:hypothetical protein [Bradyrhizobium sp. Arg816]MDI3560170.1 hypothetical protein [Bradyrhizobium sp. Arg816]